MTRCQMGKWIWKLWRMKRRAEKEVKRMSNVQLWDASKSVSKAKAAAVPVGVGAAVVALLRSLIGDSLPWEPAQDAWVATILVAALSYIWTYFRDKKKHGGGGVFHTLSPEQQAAQTAFLKQMHETAEAARKDQQ